MSRLLTASKSGSMAAKSDISAGRTRINVIYYSMYGHIATSTFQYIIYKINLEMIVFFLVAKSVVKGAEAAGAEIRLIQVPETLSQDVLTKMHAKEKDKNV